MKKILVIGSKPNAVMPLLKFDVVITANAAAIRGLEYKKQGSYLVCVVGGGEFKKKIVQENIKKAKPDEVIISGKGFPNPAYFIKNALELKKTKVVVLNYKERFSLMKKVIGYKSYVSSLKASTNHLKFFLRIMLDTIKNKHLSWAKCSTGLTAILYANNKYKSKKIICTGISLVGGAHTYGKMRTNRARVDASVMSFWKPEKRSFLYSTDEQMIKAGKVKRWTGKHKFFSD